MSNIKTPAKPSRRVLQVIVDGLEEIEGHFAWEGIGANEEETSSSEDVDVSDSNEGDDDSYEEPYYTAGFDREDVELAIDEFLSHLLRKRLIRKDGKGAVPSFADVIAKFFGDDHEIAKAAESFEEYIAGYFGSIDYENMKAAYDEFVEIQTFVKKELEAAGLA